MGRKKAKRFDMDRIYKGFRCNDSKKINETLEKFYEFQRGDKLPDKKDWYGKAYLATQKVMCPEALM